MKRGSDPADPYARSPKRSCPEPETFSVASAAQELVRLAQGTINKWSPDVSLERLRHSCAICKCLEAVISSKASTQLLESALEALLMCRCQLQAIRIGTHAQMALQVSHGAAVAAFSEDLAHFMALCLCESVLQLGGFDCPASWWHDAPGLGTPDGWLIPPGMRVKNMTAEHLDSTIMALLQYFGSSHWIEKASDMARRVALLGVSLHWRASELLVGHMYSDESLVPRFLERRLHWANATCLILAEVAKWLPKNGSAQMQPTPVRTKPPPPPAPAPAPAPGPIPEPQVPVVQYQIPASSAAPAPVVLPVPSQRCSVFNMAISSDELTLYATYSQHHYILQITVKTGVSKILSGGIEKGFVDGIGLNSRFNSPSGLAISPDGTTLFVADSGNNCIRFVDIPDGAVHTLVGSPAIGCVDGCGAQARLNAPASLALSPDGSVLFLADAVRRCIRQITIRAAMVTTLGASCKFKVGHINIPIPEVDQNSRDIPIASSPQTLDLILCLSLSQDSQRIIARGGPNTHIRQLLLGQSDANPGFALKKLTNTVGIAPP